MTGRSAGFCAGNDVPGFTNTGRGAGRGRGFGGGVGGRGGRGFRNMFWATGLPGWARFGGAASAPGSEKEALEQQLRALEASLDQVRHKLDEIQKDSSGA
jgi:hypothetical protein